MITDLVQIRSLTESHESENIEFRRYLKSHHYSLEPFQTLATEVAKQIDCQACANCCRQTVVNVGNAEIEVIARYLGMEPIDVTRKYTEPDATEPSARILINRNDNCVFLDGNLCIIYEVRPKPCRDFPHVAPGTHSLGGRLASLCRSAGICPILFNALERYKHIVGFRPA